MQSQGRPMRHRSHPEPEITFRRGVPPGVQSDAVQMYWQAFSPKLGRVLGPDAQAIDLLSRAVQPDHAVVALDGAGALVAMAGFRSTHGAYMPLSPRNLARVYGRFGGMWRSGLLRWLGEDADQGHFLIDGIVVRPDWRGRGVGSAMIAVLAAQAQAAGYGTLRLEVSDENLRARALYERLGFKPGHHQRLRVLAPVFGMSGSTVMTRPV
jgi:ribosomal protein S18 acetylase RimI-like enzyme